MASDSALRSLLSFLYTEAVFLGLFTLIVLGTAARSTYKRTVGLATLCAATVLMEKQFVPLCLNIDRPHWAATVASLLWIQLLSASDLILVSHVHADQLSKPHEGRIRAAVAALALLWNMRRIGTAWQVKNVPAILKNQSRVGFVFRRVAVTLLAYLLVDAAVSMPPPEEVMVGADKAALFSLRALNFGDIIFRCSTTVGYWLTTGILVLFMKNLGAIVAVILGLSSPDECPPLYGSFLEAYTIRRFWGVSWHQMFRSFLTGLADLIVDGILPFLPRHSAGSRYTRLMIAFLISGLIHARADQLMGVPNAENGAVAFFLLHAAFIMIEDSLGTVFGTVVPGRLRQILGCLWVGAFFAWSSPIWCYSGMRLGLSSAALLPVRVVGPWIERSLLQA